jgi:two-component system sensor histidine kinase KdpD
MTNHQRPKGTLYHALTNDQHLSASEAQRQATNGKPTAPSAASARVLVCISEQPSMQQIIRSAVRLATERRAELYALHVEQPGNSTRCRPESAAQYASNARLAHDLGAQVELVRSHHVAASILQFAREHHISTIVLGRSCHTHRRLFGDDLVEQVRKGSGTIEVRVLGEGP